jgi:hypothetical protein
MARFGIYAPAQDVATIWEAATAVADAIRGSGDTRTLGQRRVDALVMICSDILSAGGWHNLKLPDKGLGRPRVNVTIPYTVLLGHRAPCELAGHGPISTEQAQFLVGTGDLYRMICDPVTGQLLDYGRERYRPPPHLAEFVRMRDGECPLPSCHHPAGRGQLDHIVPAKPDPVTGKPTLGTTCADNLAPPCPHDHLSKDAGRGFTVHRSTDGTYTWTTPLGRVYTWRPEPLWHLDTDALPSDSGSDEGGGASRCGPTPACACLPRTGPSSGKGGSDGGDGEGNGDGTADADARVRPDAGDGAGHGDASVPLQPADGAGRGDASGQPDQDDAAHRSDHSHDAHRSDITHRSDGDSRSDITHRSDGDSRSDITHRSDGDSRAAHAPGVAPRDGATAGGPPAPTTGTSGGSGQLGIDAPNSEVQVCDCPESCACQHDPLSDPSDLLLTLSVAGDWADGFLAPADPADEPHAEEAAVLGVGAGHESKMKAQADTDSGSQPDTETETVAATEADAGADSGDAPPF